MRAWDVIGAAAKAALIIALLCALLPLRVSAQQDSIHTFTDQMSVSEFQRAGLNKLTDNELSALNVWIAKLLLNGPGIKRDNASSIGSNRDEGVNLYTSKGYPVAYVLPAEENTIFLWSGKPVAYLDSDNIYGFNGKHLGWFDDGKIYDHQGRIVGTTAEAAVVQLKSGPTKPLRQFSPFKAFEQFAPFKPFYKLSWADLPLDVFLAEGR